MCSAKDTTPCTPQPTLNKGGCFMKRELIPNMSGNEGYYTEYSLLVILKFSCGKLYCQKSWNSIIISYNVQVAAKELGKVLLGDKECL